MYIFENPQLLQHLDPMIALINHDDQPADSFRSLFTQINDKWAFNVTNNQFKRIKHYLQTMSAEKPQLWENPLFVALCTSDCLANEILEETAPADYRAKVANYYAKNVPVIHTPAQSVAPTEMKLFGADIKNVVLAEIHGTRTPLATLGAGIDELLSVHASVSIEGLSTEEIDEINACNTTHACSMLLYMLIPVERSIQSASVALEKRQLIFSLIQKGIRIIPGDNQYSVNLPAGLERLRLFNYSAIQNASSAASEGPIVFLVGLAHAIKTEGCPGIASLIGAKLINLTGDAPLVSEPFSASSGLLAEKQRLFATSDVTVSAFGASTTFAQFRPA